MPHRPPFGVGVRARGQLRHPAGAAAAAVRPLAAARQAVLATLGATPPMIRGVVVTEGMLTSSVSVLVAVVASTAAAWRAARLTAREALTGI